MYSIRLMDPFFVFLGWFCGGDAMLYSLSGSNDVSQVYDVREMHWL